MTEQWARQVQAALQDADATRLRELFDLAVAAEGPQRAAQSWLAVVAAFDAQAQTG